MSTQSRSSILLVSGSCSIFALSEPPGIGHQNLIPVPIPLTPKSVFTGIVCQIDRQSFPDLLSQAGLAQLLHMYDKKSGCWGVLN